MLASDTYNYECLLDYYDQMIELLKQLEARTRHSATVFLDEIGEMAIRSLPPAHTKPTSRRADELWLGRS